MCRATCNTCGQARPARKASAAVAVTAQPPESCATQARLEAPHRIEAGTLDACSLPSDPAASSAFQSRQDERHTAAAVPAQPGFVDFAALSRRIFGTESSASNAVPPAESRTYEAAPAASCDAVSPNSTAQAGQCTAQTASTWPDTQAQRRNSRTYEVAQALPAGRGGRTISNAQKDGCQHDLTCNADVGVPTVASGRQPARPRQHQAEAPPKPSVVLTAPPRSYGHGSVAEMQSASRTVPSARAADCHQPMPTSDEEYSGNATDGDRTTDSDVELRRRHRVAGRHRSWQQSARTAVGYR